MKMPQIKIDTVIVDGGLDQVTPTLLLKNGYLRESSNFEIGVNGGITRIGGYERYDGQTSPSDTTTSRLIISVATMTNTPTKGQVITGQISGETATVADVDGLKIYIAKLSGTFQLEEIRVASTVIGTIDNLSVGITSAKEEAVYEAAVADIYRADISEVPGVDSVLGVFIIDDVVYAFRNNVGATACDIYKSTGSGWVLVPFFKTVSFNTGTLGSAPPADNNSIIQGAVSATIKRVVITSGTFSGNDAAGQMIITTPTGGNFSAASANVGASTATLEGVETDVSLLPDGRFEFVEANFYGQEYSTRFYGCDGVNPAFEFDGEILVPIYTTATTDNPSHIIKHGDCLFLSIRSSFFISAVGDPYNYQGVDGALEIATGTDIVGFKTMPGTGDASLLAVFSRSRVHMLYGKSATDYKLVHYTDGTGAVEYTVQNMTDTLSFDDMGLYSLRAATEYGNFAQATYTAKIQPFINEHLGQAIASTISRGKSQYRLFYDNGFGFYATIVNGKLKGAMPVNFEDKVNCAWESKLHSGITVMFLGGQNGFVYQLDKGTSFDGVEIVAQATTTYTASKNTRVKKRFRKCSMEISTDTSSYVEILATFLLGYGSTEYAQPLGSDESLFLSQPRWDGFIWDAFTWDAKSINPLEIELCGTAENVAITIYSAADYIKPFNINSLIYHYTDRRMMR